MSKADSTHMFSKLEQRFDNMQEREQKLLFWGIPFTVLVVMYLLFIEPQWIATQKLHKKVDSLDKQLLMTQSSIEELNREARVDLNSSLKTQIDSLTTRLSSIEQAFKNELGQLVSPEAMVLLLQQFFDQAEDLRLIKLTSIAPTLAFSEENTSTPIYRHGIDITFEGSFFATRDFLTAAENLPYKVYWENLSYEVNEYPNATSKLSLFTLSTSEAFISVY